MWTHISQGGEGLLNGLKEVEPDQLYPFVSYWTINQGTDEGEPQEALSTRESADELAGNYCAVRGKRPGT